MADDVFGFNRQDADALLRRIGDEGGEVPQFSQPEAGGRRNGVAKADAIIAAGTATSPGSGAGALQTIVSGAWSAGLAITMNNPFPVAIAAGQPLPVIQIDGGDWVIASPSLSAVTAVTDNQVGTNNLEEKTQQFHAPGVQAESAFTEWHLGTTCS